MITFNIQIIADDFNGFNTFLFKVMFVNVSPILYHQKNRPLFLIGLINEKNIWP